MHNAGLGHAIYRVYTITFCAKGDKTFTLLHHHNSDMTWSIYFSLLLLKSYLNYFHSQIFSADICFSVFGAFFLCLSFLLVRRNRGLNNIRHKQTQCLFGFGFATKADLNKKIKKRKKQARGQWGENTSKTLLASQGFHGSVNMARLCCRRANCCAHSLP